MKSPEKFIRKPDGSIVFRACKDLDDYVKKSAALAAAPTPPAQQFSNEDLPLPEDNEILAAHPLNTKDFHSYGEAQRLVSAKHSKFALVDLVNWLLSRIPPVQEAEPVYLTRGPGHASYLHVDSYSVGYYKKMGWAVLVAFPVDLEIAKAAEKTGALYYTRPANDKLRQAAREAAMYINPEGKYAGGPNSQLRDEILSMLRAALERKSC